MYLLLKVWAQSFFRNELCLMIFLKLSRPTLIKLATALETGRLSPPFTLATIVNYVPAALSQEIVGELNFLRSRGVHSKHIAYTLRLLAAERGASQEVRDRFELVWTGQEVIGTESRDTRVVVRELFNSARTSVLISSFAIDKGEKARTLFQVLADQMDNNSTFQVRMFLNVQRPHNSDEPDSNLLRKFTATFCNEIWFGQRYPDVFYDPRSLALGTHTKACLHAKCVVVDEERVFITSANFTQAAHERNIEAGVLLADSQMARAVRTQFETLVAKKILCRVPGI